MKLSADRTGTYDLCSISSTIVTSHPPSPREGSDHCEASISLHAYYLQVTPEPSAVHEPVINYRVVGVGLNSRLLLSLDFFLILCLKLHSVIEIFYLLVSILTTMGISW